MADPRAVRALSETIAAERQTALAGLADLVREASPPHRHFSQQEAKRITRANYATGPGILGDASATEERRAKVRERMAARKAAARQRLLPRIRHKEASAEGIDSLAAAPPLVVTIKHKSTRSPTRHDAGSPSQGEVLPGGRATAGCSAADGAADASG